MKLIWGQGIPIDSILGFTAPNIFYQSKLMHPFFVHKGVKNLRTNIPLQFNRVNVQAGVGACGIRTNQKLPLVSAYPHLYTSGSYFLPAFEIDSFSTPGQWNITWSVSSGMPPHPG